MANTRGEGSKAATGQRMIELKVRFWTNNLADAKGLIRPKHAWSSGVVRIEPNSSHGIAAGKPVPFNSLMHLPAVMEKVLIQHGIVLHPDSRTRRYFKAIGD